MLSIIFSTVYDILISAFGWVRDFCSLLVSVEISGTYPNLVFTHHVTVLGLFVIVLPLVGLGIGIIIRLIKIRS